MHSRAFFGRNVLFATFVLALFGWGIGFYGPPIYLHAVVQRTGWSITLCSAAVTWHFLIGTLLVANLPRLHRHFGIPRVTLAGTLTLCLGVYGWAIARVPVELFVAATLTGLGWVTLGAAAVNALISPWYVRRRPAALGMAYNGASLGGVVFSSAWVWLIDHLGFPRAALWVGLATLAILAWLSIRVFRHRPEDLGQHPDGAEGPPDAPGAGGAPAPLAGQAPWRDRRFITLAAGMSFGLFAQIGLVAHLFGQLAPRLGEQRAALAIGLATLSAILGRTLVGWLMPVEADRRLAPA